jgi:hypothetical protein
MAFPLPIASALIAVLLATPSPAPAPSATWNDCGHRVIAAIAFGQMAPEARDAVVSLLREHPAAKDATFWLGHEKNSDDPELNLFLNASVFPDDAPGRSSNMTSAGPMT